MMTAVVVSLEERDVLREVVSLAQPDRPQWRVLTADAMRATAGEFEFLASVLDMVDAGSLDLDAEGVRDLLTESRAAEIEAYGPSAARPMVAVIDRILSANGLAGD